MSPGEHKPGQHQHAGIHYLPWSGLYIHRPCLPVTLVLIPDAAGAISGLQQSARRLPKPIPLPHQQFRQLYLVVRAFHGVAIPTTDQRQSAI